MKEWECPNHGPFIATHPMCPAIGCEAEIKRVFITAPAIGSSELKRFHAGLKQSVDLMGLGNLRSARAGETAYGGTSGLLWGDAVKETLGVDVAGLTAFAAKPLKVTYKDGHEETIEKSVMRELGEEGITQQVLPRPAELLGHRQERAKRK